MSTRSLQRVCRSENRFRPDLKVLFWSGLWKRDRWRSSGKEIEEEQWFHARTGGYPFSGRVDQKSCKCFLQVSDWARPAAEQVVTFIMFGTGGFQILKKIRSWLLDCSIKVLIETGGLCTSTGMNLVQVNFPLLRRSQQSFCLDSLTSLCRQYEISVEQLVLTELDSVLKVKNPSLIITINTSIKLELLVQSSSLLLTVGSSCHCQWKEATW